MDLPAQVAALRDMLAELQQYGFENDGSSDDIHARVEALLQNTEATAVEHDAQVELRAREDEHAQAKAKLDELRAQRDEARAAADTNGASLDQCEARARVLLEDNERLKALLDIQKQATVGAQNICVSEQGDRELAEHVARAVVAERDEVRVALAATLARERALRMLLRPLIDAAAAWACQDPPSEVIRAECERAETLLAQPVDDAALRALLLKVAIEVEEAETSARSLPDIVAAVLKGTP